MDLNRVRNVGTIVRLGAHVVDDIVAANTVPGLTVAKAIKDDVVLARLAQELREQVKAGALTPRRGGWVGKLLAVAAVAASSALSVVAVTPAGAPPAEVHADTARIDQLTKAVADLTAKVESLSR